MRLIRISINSNDIKPEQSSCCGVYRIFFGEKFYVGKAVSIKIRTQQHESELWSLLQKDDLFPANHYLVNVYRHLKENPEIKTGELEVLEQCTWDELISKEQKWLSQFEHDPMCLNVGFIAKPSSGDVKKMNKENASTKNT